MMPYAFFKQNQFQVKKFCTTIAVSISYAMALNYHDYCKRHKEAMSFSHCLTFSTSLMQAVMKEKPKSHNDQPLEDQTKFRDLRENQDEGFAGTIFPTGKRS